MKTPPPLAGKRGKYRIPIDRLQAVGDWFESPTFHDEASARRYNLQAYRRAWQRGLRVSIRRVESRPGMFRWLITLVCFFERAENDNENGEQDRRERAAH